MNIAEGIFLGGLAGFSVYDLKTKKVPVAAVALFGTAVLIYRLCTGAGPAELLPGVLPGLALLLAAVCTKESIGTGDGLLLCVLGVFCGIKKAMAVLGMALVFAALLAVILLVIKRAGKKTELPFLPCLFAGYLLGLLW